MGGLRLARLGPGVAFAQAGGEKAAAVRLSHPGAAPGSHRCGLGCFVVDGVYVGFDGCVFGGLGRVDTNASVKECVEQFPKVMGPVKMTPDYVKCIRTSTQASRRLSRAIG